MLTVLEDGSMVEIATVGREGMIGVSAVLDDTPVTSAAMAGPDSRNFSLPQYVLDEWTQKLAVAPMPTERPHVEPKHK